MNLKHFSGIDVKFKDILYDLFGTKRTEMEIHVHKGGNRTIDPSGNKPTVTAKPTKPTEEVKCEDKANGEVFHIPANKYGYDEANEVCKLFDARLATYDEIEDAYKKGANWCSYGWSSDQLALFPIQRTMYNELKKIPGHERDCGRTGINGGYMDNKNLKFGVNCYGKKPYAGEDDLEYMKRFSFSNAYPDDELKALEKRKAKKLLVAPFNKDKWNEE